MIRVSLSRFDGVAPEKAIAVDKARGWFTIEEADLRAIAGQMTGPLPTQIAKPRISVTQTNIIVVRDPPGALPCIHRQNRIADTPCGGCGNRRYVEVFACALHTACTINRAAKDQRIKNCAGCKDRSAAQEIPFASYKNKYAGKTATIVGRGETTFPDEDLAKLDGPVFFLNDAAQLEKHCQDNPNTFLMAQDKRIVDLLPGLRSVAVLPLGLGIAFEVRHNPIPNIGKVCWTIAPGRSEDYLLDITRDELEIERRLYRPGRAPTICSAIHFAWFTGCTHVRLIRCDGIAAGYAKDLENISKSPEIPHQYPQTRIDAENVMAKLGMTWEFVGALASYVPPPVKREFCVTATETDAPGRAALNAQAWESLKNIDGLNLKECTLYINIDPVPGGVGPHPTVAAASQFFGKVVVNTPENPDFSAAFKWCMSMPHTEYFLHFEADWLVTEYVHIDELLRVLLSDASLACVNLRAYSFKSDDPRICLSPGLWRTAAAREISGMIEAGLNPETQLRSQTWDSPRGGKQGKWRGVPYPADRNARFVVDIGREWIAGTKYRRPVKNVDFSTWDAV